MTHDKPNADRRKLARWLFLLAPAAVIAGTGRADAQCAYGCGPASVRGTARRTSRRTARRVSRRH